MTVQQEFIKSPKLALTSTPFPQLQPTLPEVPLQHVQEMIEKKDALEQE